MDFVRELTNRDITVRRLKSIEKNRFFYSHTNPQATIITNELPQTYVINLGLLSGHAPLGHHRTETAIAQSLINAIYIQ